MIKPETGVINETDRAVTNKARIERRDQRQHPITVRNHIETNMNSFESVSLSKSKATCFGPADLVSVS